MYADLQQCRSSEEVSTVEKVLGISSLSLALLLQSSPFLSAALCALKGDAFILVCSFDLMPERDRVFIHGDPDLETTRQFKHIEIKWVSMRCSAKSRIHMLDTND